MLNLTTTSSIVRVVTGAAGTITTEFSFVDILAGVASAGGGVNAAISTAATNTIVAAPAVSTVRNVKGIRIANDHATVSVLVEVQKYDGTNFGDLAYATLKSKEVLAMDALGVWRHYDSNGAEYPPSGLGAYAGRTEGFMKTGTASDAAGYWYCTSKDAGYPGAWAVGTPGVNGRATDGTAAADYGSIPVANPATGANYLTDFQMAASVNHHHALFDVLWVNSGLTVTTTTLQSITSGAMPARDVNGSTDGVGLRIGLLVTAAAGLVAVGSNATVTYTNSENTGSRTATLTAIVGSQAPATPVVGTIIWFNLQAGDRGVRSIQGITLGTSWVSGSISLLVARHIAKIGTTIVNVTAVKPISTPGIRLYNGTCLLHCVLSSATTATFFDGEITVSEK